MFHVCIYLLFVLFLFVAVKREIEQMTVNQHIWLSTDQSKNDSIKMA